MHFEEKQRLGAMLLVTAKQVWLAFWLFFATFPKQPNAWKFLNVKHLETEIVFVLVHNGLQKIGAFDNFRLSTKLSKPRNQACSNRSVREKPRIFGLDVDVKYEASTCGKRWYVKTAKFQGQVHFVPHFWSMNNISIGRKTRSFYF